MLGAVLSTLVLIGSSQPPSPDAAHWALQVASAQCVLERQRADGTPILSIETAPGSDSFRVAIAGKPSLSDEALGPASLTFAPSNHVMNGYARIVRGQDGEPLLWMQGVAPSLLDALSAAQSVTMTTRQDESAAISVPGAQEAVVALRRCSEEQLIEWGADPAQFQAGGTPPMARKSRDEWLPDRDVLAIGKESSRAQINDLFRVVVSTKGKVEDCRALASEVEPGVEKVACAAVMNRPLFTPARDPRGNPVRGVATFRVLVMREAA